jgi:uncharacterized protein
MNERLIVQNTENFVKETLKDDKTGHSWPHIQRVRKTSKYINKEEGVGEPFITEMGALLHDIDDFKFNKGNTKVGSDVARIFLEKQDIDQIYIAKICYIVENVSFKGVGVPAQMDLIEGKYVQDGDRLDSMGAIGISRTFHYGGVIKRPIYDPNIVVQHHTSVEDYLDNPSSSINHFDEKLLLIYDLLHTETARQIGKPRHDIMLTYKEQFLKEWNCEFK